MISDFWMEHLDEFLGLMREQQYGQSTIRHCKITAEQLIIGTWQSYEDAISYYRNECPLSRERCMSYLSILKKLQAYHLNGAAPVYGRIQCQLEYVKPSLGELDLTYLQGHLHELLSYMEAHGYCKDMIKKTGFVASRIIVLSRTIAWDSYADIWGWYLGNGHREGYLHDIRCILGMLENFHLHGLYPNNREAQNPLCIRRNNYSGLNPEYRALVDFGCKIEESRGLKPSSIRTRRGKISSLLHFLQEVGEDSLQSVSEENVVSFFYKDGERLRGHSTYSAIATFLKDAMEYDPVACRRLLSYVPKVRKMRSNIQYLTDAECNAFRSALEDMGNGISYKHRAIGTILYYTGMRCSDISDLRLDSVDLNRREIRFSQRKTDNQAVLPLSAVVGNAIIDYCVKERPETDSQYLFVTDDAPHHKLIKGGIQWAVEKIMEASGIRQNEGDRKGGHIFRHRAVSRMSENNVPAPVISAAVGHVNPKSLDSYLYADMAHIRSCALGLGKYPMAEEVFSYV